MRLLFFVLFNFGLFSSYLSADLLLHKLIKNNSEYLVESLRHAVTVSHCSVEQVDEHGFTPLHQAAFLGKTNAVAFLLDEGQAQINAQSPTGLTPLHRAVMGNQPKTLEFLLILEADATIPDREGKLPITYATQLQNDEAIRLLIPALAKNLDSGLHNEILLSFIQTNAESQRVQELLSLKAANVDSKAEAGMTSLHFASWQGNLSTVKILLKAGAKVNASNVDENTPLILAAHRNQNEVAIVLLNAGAEVNAKNSFGATALHIAAANCNLPLIEILISNGAQPQNVDNNGLNALHHAAMKCSDPTTTLHLLKYIKVNECPRSHRKRKAINFAIENDQWMNALVLAFSDAKYGKSTKRLLSQKRKNPEHQTAANNITYAFTLKQPKVDFDLIKSLDVNQPIAPFLCSK